MVFLGGQGSVFYFFSSQIHSPPVRFIKFFFFKYNSYITQMAFIMIVNAALFVICLQHARPCDSGILKLIQCYSHLSASSDILLSEMWGKCAEVQQTRELPLT